LTCTGVTDVCNLFSDLAEHKFGGQDYILRINIKDSFIPENSGVYIIFFNNGRAKTTANENYDMEIALDISECSTLVVEAVDFKSLVNLGLVEVSDSTWIDPINEVFRAKHKPLCVTGF